MKTEIIKSLNINRGLHPIVCAAIEHYQQTIKLEPQFYNAQKRIEYISPDHPELTDANAAVK